jgi:beta-barrel assembly-enhancing protease
LNTLVNKRLLLFAICLCMLSIGVGSADVSINKDQTLPVLGDPLSGIISPDKEAQIGQLLSRQIRRQLPIVSDPLSNDYLQALSYRLAANSELQQKKLDTFIIKDDAINAFAMPGGVIAMHTGLFLHAKSEDEFSAVLAHEIAHLSQRHFARMISQQKNSQAATLGAYLASILILMTVGTEPGIGALAATQAAAQQESLRFSRKNEQEADRIGMQTLVNSGMDPNAMTAFFLQLQKESQYAGNKPPEYLLTHPVTEARIADAQSRASQYPRKLSDDKLEYHLIRNRLRVISSKDTHALERSFESNKTEHQYAESPQQTGERYGLVLVHMENKKFKMAQKLLADLMKKDPHRITYLLTKAEIEFAQENYSIAKKTLEGALDLHPNNYPLSMLYAETLIRNKQIGEAIYLLQTLSLSQNDNPYVWRRLAEAHGLMGHQLSVYRAKAEYFYLYGLNTNALEQLKFALPLANENYQLRSKIETRIEQIENEETEISL